MIKLIKKLWYIGRNKPVHAIRNDNDVITVKYINGEVKEYFFSPWLREILGQDSYISNRREEEVKMVLSYIKQYGNPYPTAHLKSTKKIG